MAKRLSFYNGERGYALTSVLLLIVVISLVGAAVISLHYLLRQHALSEVALVKAEFAAESGIARFLSEFGSMNDFAREAEVEHRNYTFADGSSTRVEAVPWGVLLVDDVKKNNEPMEKNP